MSLFGWEILENSLFYFFQMMIIVRKMNFFVKKYVKNIDLRRITIVKNMFFLVNQ